MPTKNIECLSETCTGIACSQRKSMQTSAGKRATPLGDFSCTGGAPLWAWTAARLDLLHSASVDTGCMKRDFKCDPNAISKALWTVWNDASSVLGTLWRVWGFRREACGALRDAKMPTGRPSGAKIDEFPKFHESFKISWKGFKRFWRGFKRFCFKSFWKGFNRFGEVSRDCEMVSRHFGPSRSDANIYGFLN